MQRTLPLILAVSLFMEQIDSTVIATALPAIARDIGTSPVALKLALTAYLVALAIFIPVSGWLADRFGASRVFRWALGVFMVGSLACAVSNSLPAFVGARFLQGIGGAMMTPVARLVLIRTTPKDRLVDAMALLTIPALIGPFIGPPLGGFITTFFSWHWIFLINLPIGLIGIVLARRYVPDMKGPERSRLDWIGFGFAGLAAAGLIFGLSVISLPALPPVVGIATVILGLACGVLYLRHARQVEKPLLDTSLFAIRSYRSTIIGMSLFRMGAGATPFLLPLFFQLSFGMTPFESGMITFMGAAGALITKFVAARTLRFIGFRTALVSAALIGGAMTGSAIFFTPQTPVALIMAILLIGGLFRSLFFTAGNALVYADIDDRRAASATATTSVLQQLSIALGVAFGGLLLELFALPNGDIPRHGFDAAFIGIACAGIIAVIPFALLPKETGAMVSGHRAAVGRADGGTRPRLGPRFFGRRKR